MYQVKYYEWSRRNYNIFKEVTWLDPAIARYPVNILHVFIDIISYMIQYSLVVLLIVFCLPLFQRNRLEKNGTVNISQLFFSEVLTQDTTWITMIGKLLDSNI